MGRLQMNQFAVTADFAGEQFGDTQLVPGFKTNQPRLGWVGSDGSLCSAATYSGSLLNFYNLLVNTERTFLRIWQEELTFFSRNAIGVFGVSSFALGRTAGALTVGYSNFERINLGLEYMNQVQTQPAGLATQQATNAASVTAYGAQGFTVSTVDANTTAGFRAC
jgi:hypothetical protein